MHRQFPNNSPFFERNSFVGDIIGSWDCPDDEQWSRSGRRFHDVQRCRFLRNVFRQYRCGRRLRRFHFQVSFIKICKMSSSTQFFHFTFVLTVTKCTIFWSVRVSQYRWMYDFIFTFDLFLSGLFVVDTFSILCKSLTPLDHGTRSGCW